MKGVLRRIRFERLQRGWNQTDLAQLAHVRQQNISLIEQGRLIPNTTQLDRLASAFGIDPAELLKPHVAVVDPEKQLEQVQ